MRLNNAGYSAYPAEQEVLLNEGCPVCVLDVEEVVIKNEDETFSPYNGKSVVLVYLYNPSHDN